MSDQPNILIVMTDEERYPPPYEDESVREFRRTSLPARESLRTEGVELHRHYAASTACVPSRASLFTGQYPSLHGVTSTDGLAKNAYDPGMRWLDPATVPTLGDWFRAGGYTTHYRGKWHISEAALTIPGTHEALRTNSADGTVDPEAVDLYLRADRLDGYGFSGWIGREPHGADPSDLGSVKDALYADQVGDMFTALAAAAGPWCAVASFVNPHDIAFAGIVWDKFFDLGPIPDFVPEIAPAPSDGDAFAGRPSAQEQFTATWPKFLYPQGGPEYRQLYYYLHAMVDAAIARMLDALRASGMADNTIVMFTSDHGDLLGAHGGMVQKWHNAYDEAVRVPMVVSGPGIATRAGGVDIATSHIDVLPTLLGLAGIDADAVLGLVAQHHVETHPLPGRDLSEVLLGRTESDQIDAPIYFMTEDQITRGLSPHNRISGEPFDPVPAPDKVESVIARLPTGAAGSGELWKCNQYYDRLPEWEAARGLPVNAFLAEPAPAQWELHNLTADPDERTNRAATDVTVLAEMQALLDTERDAKRRLPAHRNR